MSLLQMSFVGAVMILAIIVIRTLTINLLPKKTFGVLWGIAVVRLLLPLSLPSVLSVYSLLSEYTSVIDAVKGSQAVLALQTETPGQITTIHNNLSSTINTVSMWTVIWAIGLLISAMVFAIAYWKCQQEFQTSLPVNNDFITKWLNTHQQKRTISIRQSSRFSAPLTYGILRPVILVPTSTEWENTASLQYVLAHEYVHIRRFDSIKKFALIIVLCVHWFNPLVWAMYILANRDIELSCDEAVVRLFGENKKATYAQVLISMEETRNGLTPLCNNFSKNAIEERITAIMKTKKITIFSLVLASLIVVGVGTAFTTSAQANNNNPTSDGQEYKTTNASENASDYNAIETSGGNMDYGIYEEYGLIYDKDSKCYTYKGNVVRFFNDPVGGASFTNFFTGTVDIEAERDTNDKLIGIRECTKEIYDRHTEKYENSGLKSMPAGTSTENGNMIRNHESYSMESGDKTENMNTLQDYESYGVVYHPKDGYWYYNDQIIGIFIDSEKPIVYFNDSGSIYLSIAKNSENGVMEIKEISEAEAQKLLRDNNSSNSASFTVEEP